MTAKTSMLARTAALVAGLAISGPALAEGLPAKPGPDRAAKMFNLVCLSKLPDIKAIGALATQNKFAKLSPAALKPYAPQASVDEAHGWRFKDFGATFTLVVTRAKPDAQFKAAMPAFANSTNYACSLILPNKFAKAAVIAAVSKVVGRKHDETWEQGPMLVHSWKGQTDKLFIQAFHYAGKARGTSSLLSASMFVKK